MSNKVTVVVRNLSKVYHLNQNGSAKRNARSRKGTEVNALKSTSFVAKAGQCIGILGANGAGKSTLMNLIAGTENPSTGLVRVSAQPTLLGISAALQPHLSGRANVRLGLLAMGLTPEEVNELINPVLDWAELREASDRPMKTYSAGMKSRLKFSIATSVRREILLIDEALSAGDATFADKAAKRMSDFLEDAGTVFIVSHSATTIDKYCNRVLWLHEGEVIADGLPEAITKSYKIWSRHRAKGDLSKAAAIIDRRKEQFTALSIMFDSEVIKILDSA